MIEKTDVEPRERTRFHIWHMLAREIAFFATKLRLRPAGSPIKDRLLKRGITRREQNPANRKTVLSKGRGSNYGKGQTSPIRERRSFSTPK